MNKEITISERQRKCLEFLVEFYGGDENCVYFSYIAEQTGLEKREARIAVRALVRKGLAKYVRGLVDDDMMLAGNGHCATKEGVDYIEKIKEE